MVQWQRISLPVQEMQETWVQSQGQKDPLEEEMAPFSSILARKNSMNRGAWQFPVHGITKSQTQWATECACTHTHTHTHTHIPGNTIALEEISVAVCKRCSIVKQIWKILLTNGQMAFFTAINMLTWTVDLLRACATCVLYQSYILKKQLWEMFISEKPQPPIELVANRARHPCWHHLGKLRLAL